MNSYVGIVKYENIAFPRKDIFEQSTSQIYVNQDQNGQDVNNLNKSYSKVNPSILQIHTEIRDIAQPALDICFENKSQSVSDNDNRIIISALSQSQSRSYFTFYCFIIVLVAVLCN